MCTVSACCIGVGRMVSLLCDFLCRFLGRHYFFFWAEVQHSAEDTAWLAAALQRFP